MSDTKSDEEISRSIDQSVKDHEELIGLKPWEVTDPKGAHHYSLMPNEENYDRFTILPEEILLKILSFLSAKDILEWHTWQI